jgi:hypothetical protein
MGKTKAEKRKAERKIKQKDRRISGDAMHNGFATKKRISPNVSMQNSGMLLPRRDAHRRAKVGCGERDVRCPSTGGPI